MVHEPQLDLLPESGDLPEDDIRTQVWALLTTLYPKNGLTERRRHARYPFPYLVHLTPLDDQGNAKPDGSLAVIGKHLSEKGLSFYHSQPIPHRRMIVSIETRDQQWISFMIDLSWCRFTRQGWYESGGRFLESVEPPISSFE